MGICVNCKKQAKTISNYLGLCLDCIRKDFSKVTIQIKEVHKKAREKFSLPPFPPNSQQGIMCTQCINKCQIQVGEIGYCGIRKNIDGKLVDVSHGLLDWYFDSLPTNCVAEWVCPGSYAHGYKNLAVFYRACNFNCLFCQNWHWRVQLLEAESRPWIYRRQQEITPEELASNVDEDTFCICYFGGDPIPQIQHAIKTSEIATEERVRICWETNGSMSPQLLDKVADLSFRSGGCIKFDLKAWDEGLNIALCGVSNKQTIENFSYLAEWFNKKSIPRTHSHPFLIASTLLIPGYVDLQEIRNISHFIAELNPEIPYSLLAFYPCFLMSDLPTTSREQAESSFQAAKEMGLKNVHIGNLHLLS